MSEKRFILMVGNVGQVDIYTNKLDAMAQARCYHNGDFGGRAKGEGAYIIDTKTDEIVFELDPVGRKIPKTRIEVTEASIVALKHAILCLPDDERLTATYADLWAVMLQAEDRLAAKAKEIEEAE
jgi:hypothetical protein